MRSKIASPFIAYNLKLVSMSATGPITATPQTTYTYSYSLAAGDVKAHQAMLATLCPALVGPFKDDEAMESAIDHYLTKEILFKIHDSIKARPGVSKELLKLIQEVLMSP
jgi:hypothetical protein